MNFIWKDTSSLVAFVLLCVLWVQNASPYFHSKRDTSRSKFFSVLFVSGKLATLSHLWMTANRSSVVRGLFGDTNTPSASAWESSLSGEVMQSSLGDDSSNKNRNIFRRELYISPPCCPDARINQMEGTLPRSLKWERDLSNISS